METIKLSSKGQLVIPKSVRDALAWKPGMELCVEPARSGGVLLRPLRVFAPTRIADVLGCAGYTGRRKSSGQIGAALARGMRSRHDFRRLQRSR